jgi:branched-chain amino acid transport system ATP-binding protein
MNLVSVRSGSVVFRGSDIRGAPPYRIARLGIGLVPEGRQVFPNLTVKENLLATAASRSNGASAWSLERVYELFPILADRARHYGNQLSGGEQQMVAVGRALMTNPALLILDEATEGLAPLVRREIWSCLEQLKNLGQSILVIDKDLEALARIGDRHYILEKGRVVWHGSSAEMAGEPGVRRRYLGV